MRHLRLGPLGAVLLCALPARDARAQILNDAPAPARADVAARAPDVVCASRPGERQTCAASTARGVTLLRALPASAAACELGRTWGWDERAVWVADGCSAAFAIGEARRAAAPYAPGGGFRVAETEAGTMNIRFWTYVRYLNQAGIDQSYTDAFGNTRTLRRRDDLQLQKVNLQASGWFLTEKLRYLGYVWTSNTQQGLGAQVVVAGNLNYQFNERFTLGGGIGGLPGTRSMEGTFPYFLPLDNRLISDEFFRPSYTTGVWVKGKFSERTTYFAMLGNNLSQLGVDAGQLDGGLHAFSAAVSWLPTTGEFGPLAGFGDLEMHERVATRLGAHYTRSSENRQNQPDVEGFENSQIRTSNGGLFFAPNLFGQGVEITDLLYQMSSFDAGVKYRGFALETEYYLRWLSRFRGPGTSVIPNQFDHGFQLLGSAMAVPKKLQGYVGYGQILGERGDPREFRAGVNWFPLSTRSLKWNAEWINVRRSPVGALSLPYVVGANGNLFHLNFEINI